MAIPMPPTPIEPTPRLPSMGQGVTTIVLSWLGARLSEPSSWNAVAIGLGGAASYLSTHAFPSEATWIAAISAGASAVAAFALRERSAATPK
jgi:hypothetical protein